MPTKPAPRLQKNSQTRLFTIEDRANPASTPVYQSLARALGLTWAQGAITPIRIPDPGQYGRYIVVDKIKAPQELPTISLEGHMERELSDFLRLTRKGCDFDVQLHAGVCEDPRDFNGGWEKIYVLEGGSPTSYDTGELGNLDGTEAIVNQTMPLTGLDWYEIGRIIGGELAAAEVVQEVVGITICDSVQCGSCGIPSNGCEKIFAVVKNTGGSPGLGAQVLFSSDGGATWGTTVVSTLGATDDPSGIACVGSNLVVISNEGESLHYASLADILNGTETWAEVTTGFVAAHGPNDVLSLASTFTWFVGDGGYIYFASDPTSEVSIQSAGSQTIQNLAAIHGIDEFNLVAVGASNAVLVTHDGGNVWSALTGPNPGVVLTSVFVKSENVWLIGDASGKLWYTRDGGANWTQKGFPGSGAGQVRDIKFATPTVGYMAHSIAAPHGRILRTIDGGFSWYVLPEAAGLTIPANDYISKLAACGEDVNLVFGGGLADNGTDGIIVKFG
jgi:photosystem II stability/assembly factor-like uncharacterized protein